MANGVKWAEKKLGRKLWSPDGGKHYAIYDDEIEKLLKGPSPWWFVVPILGGFAAARLLVWLLAG